MNLDHLNVFVQTDTIANGIDTDNDGMADAFEFLYLGGLAANPFADSDGDGSTNLEEYLNATDPNAPSSALRITAFSVPDHAGANSLVTWSSSTARLYMI